MNRDKQSNIAGFMPPLALCILLGFQYAAQTGALKVDITIYGLTMLAAFVFPFIVLMFLVRGDENITLRFKPFKMRYLPFVVLMAITVSLLSFLLNWAGSILGGTTVQASVVSGSYPLWQLLLVSILLPAFCEELFFRAGLLSALEGKGFYAAMILSAFSFALVHGDLSNFVGPFIAGLIYGYMTYITGSFWSAVIAHFINNSITFGVGYLLTQYSAVGLWQYFLIVVMVAFCLFLYFSMGRLEKLIEKGKAPRIKRVGFSTTISAVFFSPGTWVLIILFILKTIYL